jgi:hypothetical protein
MKPHRGTLILVFGILGIVFCFPLGIAAWVMGKRDLKEMDAGTMDSSGRSNTNAGRICGMIGTLLAAFMVLVLIIGAILCILALSQRRGMIQAEIHAEKQAMAEAAKAGEGVFIPTVVRVAIDGTLLGDRIEAAYVSPDFFAPTAVGIARGRAINSQDCRGDNPSRVVVLSHDFWRDRVGPAQPNTDMIGSRIQIDGQATTIIGIGAPGFRPPGAGWLWLPRMER